MSDEMNQDTYDETRPPSQNRRSLSSGASMHSIYARGRRGSRTQLMFENADEATRNKLSRVSSDFRAQRELQRALLQLQQREDDYQTALEIGQSLENENEELRQQIEELTAIMQAKDMDIRVLKQKCAMLQEVNEEEHQKFESELMEREREVEILQSEVHEQQNEINLISHELQETNVALEQSAQSNDSLDRQFSTESTMSLNAIDKTQLSPIARRIYDQLIDEKQKTKEIQRRFDNLLARCENDQRLLQENEQLKIELEEMRDIQERHEEQTNVTNKAISDEIVAVAKRNAALEREVEELQQCIEERDYEIRMLESQFDMDRLQTEHVGNLALDLEDVVNTQVSPRNTAQFEREIVRTTEEQSNKRNKSQDDELAAVPDVLKEYLHLTASAVKIKFPEVKDITSEYLISKVKDLPFFQYHEVMLRIMKQQQKKLAQNAVAAKQPQKQNQGFLARVAGFFVGGTDPQTTQMQAEQNFQSVGDIAADARVL